MKGLEIGTAGAVSIAIAPKDITGGSVGDRHNLAMHRVCTFILSIGASAAAPTGVTVKSYAAASGGSGTDLPFWLQKAETAGSDVFGERAYVEATGFAPSGNDTIMYVLTVDSDFLPDGDSFVELNIAAPASAILASAIAILSGSRYQFDPNATALA
jgi:hypothetical protein